MAKQQDIIDVESTLVDIQSKTLFERVSDYLTSKDWSFSAFPDKEYFSFGLRLTSGTTRVIVDVAESPAWGRVLVYCIYPNFVPPNRRAEVSEAIIRVNYTLIFGSFEMDLKDGEIRVRTVLESDTFVSEQMIDRAVRKSIDLADQYQASILAIAFGNVGAQDILELAERAADATLQ
jgi:hypothetical protein